MVWIPLKNSSGQVVQGIKISPPDSDLVYEVVSSKRIGVNRYELTIKNILGFEDKVMNYDLRNKWNLVGDWHTPEELSKMFNTKLDPDANKQRSMRESFWKMKSKKGTINYKQKLRLMEQKKYIDLFGKYFNITIER